MAKFTFFDLSVSACYRTYSSGDVFTRFVSFEMHVKVPIRDASQRLLNELLVRRDCSFLSHGPANGEHLAWPLLDFTRS